MPTDFYTYRGDIRPLGNGSVIHYKPEPALVTSNDLAVGEMVGFKTGATFGLQRWKADGGGVTPDQAFVGICRDSMVQWASLGNQEALKARFTVEGVGVWTTGIHLLLGKAAETYVHGDKVYRDGNTNNNITKVQGANFIQIGTVHLPDGSSLVGAVRVPILIDEHTTKQLAP